jgi:hypothetical protein
MKRDRQFDVVVHLKHHHHHQIVVITALPYQIFSLFSSLCVIIKSPRIPFPQRFKHIYTTILHPQDETSTPSHPHHHPLIHASPSPPNPIQDPFPPHSDIHDGRPFLPPRSIRDRDPLWTRVRLLDGEWGEQVRTAVRIGRETLGTGDPGAKRDEKSRVRPFAFRWVIFSSQTFEIEKNKKPVD